MLPRWCSSAAAAGIIAFAGTAHSAPPSGALFGAEPSTVLTVQRPYGLVTADFDADGVRDHFVNELDRLTLYFMTAGGDVRESVSYTGEVLPPTALIDELYLETVDAAEIHAADLTGDGRPEVVLVEEVDVRVLSVSTTGFQMLAVTRAVDYMPLTTTGHFDASAAAELVLEPSHETEPYDLALMSLSGTALVELQRLPEGGTTGKSSAGFVGQPILTLDLDGDARDDLVYPGVDSAVVRLQASAGNLGAAIHIPLGGDLVSISAGDFDQDTRLDLALVSNYPAELRTFLQTATGTFIESGSAVPSDYPLLSADLDGDGTPELIGPTSVLWRDGEAWVAGEALDTGTAGTLQAVEDWDGDGLLDVVFRDAVEGEIRILPGQRADLSVRAVDVPEAIAGEPFEVTFEVRNDGPAWSGPITTTVSGTESSIAMQALPSCSADPCELPSLEPGGTAQVTVLSRPSSNETEEVVLSVLGGTYDADLENNRAAVNAPVSPRADLGGQVSLWIEDGTIDIPVWLGNSGPSRAEGVHVVVSLPEGISNVTWESNPSATCAQSGLELTCDVPELADAEGWTLDIHGGFAYRNQRVPVSGEITSSTTDPDPSNNSFSQVLPEGFLGGSARPGLAGAGDDGGCGCRVPKGRNRPGGAVIGALVAFAAAVVRRRTTNDSFLARGPAESPAPTPTGRPL